MAAKRALVVDDSKSARIVLSRMLEKYGIVVDVAESAEAALEYLGTSRPDVVFMDHLMPGMDGLQAVREIKANPATAAIPIMMYTSQEGDLYAGLARASGAVGVLPKSIHPIDVTKALYQLQLLPDRRDRAPPMLQPVDGEGAVAEAAAEAEAGTTAAGLPEPRLRGHIEHLLREQSLELRRFVVTTLDSYTHRIVSELRPREPAEPPAAPVPPPVEPEMRSAGWVAAAVLALAALAGTGVVYWQSREASGRIERALAETAAASKELGAAVEGLRQQVERATAAAATAAPAPSRTVVLSVAFGEAPLGPPRLDALRNFVNQLEREGFAGRIRVEVYAGSYCLDAVPEHGLVLAAPATPAAQCEQFGNPQDDAASGTLRQPLGFANLAATVRRRSNGAIGLELVAGPRERLAAAYPAAESATAGQWNAAAQANNRVEISLVGGP